MTEHQLKAHSNIIPVTLPTCGKCHFSQDFKSDGQAECFGMPPTPLNLGATKDGLGRVGFQIETFVPRVKASRPACALYAEKQSFETMGRG